MEYDHSFNVELSELVEKKRNQLAQQLMPQLKSNFHAVHNSFLSLYNLMLKKGALKEDPYKKEKHISSIATPEDTPLNDLQNSDDLSIRISEYDSMLEFVVNYYHFSVHEVSLKEIKNIVNLLRFIRWENFSTKSTKPTTIALADKLDKIKGGDDKLATSIIADTINQLSKLSQTITKQIKELHNFKRQEYKSDIRLRILNNLMEKFSTIPAKNEFLMRVKNEMGNQPFFHELIAELYDEEFSGDRERLLNEVRKELLVEGKKSVQKKQSVSHKTVLLDGLRNMGGIAKYLDDCAGKISDNNVSLTAKPKGLFEKFKQWIISLTSKSSGTYYPIKYVDVATGVTKTEQVEVEQFLAVLDKKSRQYGSLVNRNGQSFQRLSSLEDEQLFEYYSRFTEELIQLHRRIQGLDGFFKDNSDERFKPRGMKNEASAIKDIIGQVNQKRHEYIAKKDEAEQFKRLGIE